jgi:hypothetical protein
MATARAPGESPVNRRCRRTLHAAALALGAALATHCVPSGATMPSLEPDPEPLHASPPASVPDEREAPAHAAPDPARQLEARRLLASATRRTGLGAPAAPLQIEVLPRASLAAKAVAHTRRDLRPGTASAYAALLQRLELAPPDFDYLAALSRLVTERAVALYDADAGRISLVRELGAERERAALAHEVAHLLQDHHFQLDRRLADPRLSHDARGALLSLIEGAAIVLADELLGANESENDAAEDHELSLADDSVPTETPESAWPALLSRSLDATYEDGERLVRAVFETGGWSAVHQLLASPPATTEQLLHPDKLRLREAPVAVAVPAPPGSGWTLDYADVLGEQTLRSVLEQALSPESASAAVNGWAGDRLALFRRGDDATALAWRVVFDSEDDARRFAAAVLASWLSELDGPATPEGWCRPQRDRGVLGASQRGAAVLLLTLDTSDDPARDCAALLEGWSPALNAAPAPLAATRVDHDLTGRR